MAYSVETARDLALSGLLWMSENPDMIAGFMSETGLRPEDMRRLSSDPDLAVHILDYILQDDVRVQDLARSLNLRPEELMSARIALAGPGSHGWDAD